MTWRHCGGTHTHNWAQSLPSILSYSQNQLSLPRFSVKTSLKCFWDFSKPFDHVGLTSKFGFGCMWFEERFGLWFWGRSEWAQSCIWGLPHAMCRTNPAGQDLTHHLCQLLTKQTCLKENITYEVAVAIKE